MEGHVVRRADRCRPTEPLRALCQRLRSCTPFSPAAFRDLTDFWPAMQGCDQPRFSTPPTWHMHTTSPPAPIQALSIARPPFAHLYVPQTGIDLRRPCSKIQIPLRYDLVVALLVAYGTRAILHRRLEEITCENLGQHATASACPDLAAHDGAWRGTSIVTPVPLGANTACPLMGHPQWKRSSHPPGAQLFGAVRNQRPLRFMPWRNG